MSKSKSRIEDILEVLVEINLEYSEKNISISRSRKKAIDSVALRELRSGRFKNENSAKRTIHDACSRRLTLIGNITEFDKAAKKWIYGDLKPIKSALEYEIKSIRDKNLLTDFFHFGSSPSIKESERKLIASDIDTKGVAKPDRLKLEVYRVIRDTELSKKVKKEKGYKCEICGLKLQISTSEYYVEVHHIKPLGKPHNGPDIRGNLICVCPNHHALLDFGAIRLEKNKYEGVSDKYINYHNDVICRNQS